MKTKLFTRNIPLGLLMALVLALGVQDTTDALTFGTTRTGDLQTIVRGGTFSVTFAVTLEAEVRKSNYTTYTATYTQNGVTYYYIDSNSDGDRDSNEPQVTASTAFHYNNEAVRISVSGAGARITSIGTNTITPAASITLKEGGSGAEALAAGDITVNCSTSTHGEVTITASDLTPSEDYPSGVRKAPNFVLTTYVVQYNQAVGTTRTIRLVGVTNGVAIGYDDQRDQPIYNGDGSHYPVTYTVAGSGMIYIQEGNREGSPATTLSTSTGAKILLDMTGTTNTVTARLGGSFEESQGIYIFGNPQLAITGNSDGQSGAPNAALSTALQVTLTDNAGTPAGVVGVPIKFDVTDKSPSGGILSQDTDAGTGTTIVDASNKEISSPIPGSTMYVRTGTGGVANIDFQLGTIPGEQTVTAGALGIARLTKTIKATATGTPATRQLFVDSIDRQGSTNIYTLVARVENGGQPDAGEEVTFTTTKGLLTGATNTAKTVTATTNAAGKARVTYNIGDSAGRAEVVASISVVANSIVTQLKEVTFNVRGGSSGQQQNQQNQQNQQTSTITITPATITGEPGEEVDIIVTSSPSGQAVTIDSGDLEDDNFTRLFGITPFESTIVLPSEEDTYTFSATGPTGFTPASATVTVEVETRGRISITPIGQPINGIQTFSITVRGTDGSLISGALTVGVTGPGINRSVATANGSGAIDIRLPTTTGPHTLTASANGYTSGTTSFRGTGTGGTAGTGDTTGTGSTTGTGDTTETPPEETVGDPDSLRIIGPSTRNGTVNAELEAALIVQVLDAAGEGVEDVRVIFRVRQGQGRLSQRGNGRAIAAQTDSDGYARADFTPLIAGTITVEAEVRGITEKVTFTITPGLAPATGTPDPEDPTPSTTVSPVVNAGVPASSRPPMLWISGGKIYVLVGSEVKAFISNVENATNLTVGGGKVYWTAQTSENYGTLNSANLDGTDAKQLRTVWGVPRGITVDPTGSKLYWVDAAGRLQRSNLDASGIENVIRGLSDPKHVALSGGNAYWIGNGSGIDTLSFTNLSDPKKEIRPIASTSGISSGIYGGLTIVGSKLYWTEQTSDSHGTLYSANLDGTGITELPAEPIWGAPVGIAVDTARSRLYWTDAVGRLQRANLDASGIHNVAKGLGAPGDIVISNSIMEPVETPTTTPTTSASKYDVNADGTVDSKDVDAIIVAVAAKITDAKYDVNADGSVDINDVVAVSANRDAGTAAAPALLGNLKLTAVEVERLQEQVELLVASGDRSPAALKTLIYLQQLIVMARPEKTQLLANYPNPFNPETWIPYELATDTDVRITIYNAQGMMIRTLQLGQQSAGYYTDRQRAAYWDGRNALGEQVASGIYFYQLETDEMSTLRKMVILK